MKQWNWIFVVCWILLCSSSLFLAHAQTTIDENIGKTGAGLSDKKEAAKQRIQTLQEMENLIKLAKEAGFNENELREITVERDGEKINVWKFIEKEKKRLASTKKAQQTNTKKRYLTVEDITEDLMKKDSNQIDNLRDQLNFNGDDGS